MEYRVRFVDDQNRINLTTGSAPTGPAPAPWVRGEVRTPGFVTHDLRGYWHLNEKVTFVAGVENFGNRNYQEHLDSRVDTNYVHPGGVFRRGRNFYFLLESEY